MPKRLIILYICLYFTMIGYGLSLPLIPFFLQELVKVTDATTTQVSIHVGAVTAIFAFAQMVFAPLWGRFSDKIGRRKVILLFGLCGYALSLFEGTFVLHAQNVIAISPVQLGYVFMVCGFVMAAAQGTVAPFIEKFGAIKVLPFGFAFLGSGLAMLMLGRSMGSILVFTGILALGVAIITPSIAVLVSRYTEGQLGKSLGLLTASTSLGQTLGPIIGSLLFVINIHLPYLLSAAAVFFVTAYLFLKSRVLPE